MSKLKKYRNRLDSKLNCDINIVEAEGLKIRL